MNLRVTAPEALHPARREVEIVERKGLGHPDTLCDTLAEEFSRQLCRCYLHEFGAVLHHNVDKVLLWGGASHPAFGGGEMLEPIEVFLAGRAVTRHQGVDLPIAALARDAARSVMRRCIPGLDVDRDLRVHCLVRPSDPSLTELFRRRHERHAALANDTSLGVGFAPLSPLEELVLDLERRLQEDENHPEIGSDIKIMGVRTGRRYELTVACAFVDAYIADVGDYVARREALTERVRALAAKHVEGEIDVHVNVADDPLGGSLYLTVTGTSAECGDDGEAGRGNRASGLITPSRPMTMESIAGKNPVSHVGKLYNVAAPRIAQDLVDTLAPVTDANCLLVSRIGAPIDEPATVHLELARDDGGDPAELESEARAVVKRHLEGLHHLWQESVAQPATGHKGA